MKRKKELIIILSSLLVIVLSVSVAYFTTKILGTEKDISVTSADLKVVFTSGSGTINGTNIEPGWSSGENTFTVKNESNGTYSYNIIIKDLVNTFTTSGFLQYKITSSDGGYNMADFADVPKSSTAKDITISSTVSIAKGATHTYIVEFKYLKSDDVDQSEDMGKTLTGKIFISKLATLHTKLLSDNPTIGTRTDFTTLFKTNTPNTLYKASENGTDVFYFSGVDFLEAHCEYNGKIIENYREDSKLTKNGCLSSLTLCEINDILYAGHSNCSGKNGTTITTTQGKWVESVEKPINNWVKFGTYKTDNTVIRGYFRSFDSTDFETEHDYKTFATIEECKADERFNESCTQVTYWKAGDPIYWRIIRTNADGSIRLLYAGNDVNGNEAHLGVSSYGKAYYSDVEYTDETFLEIYDPLNAGYKYGTSGSLESNRTNENDSEIKTYIDTWYENNLTSYTNYLSNDAIYCNDRELATVDGNAYSLSTDFAYNGALRLMLNTPTPTYDCTNTKDAFSVNNNEAKLKYPIALISADEAVYASGNLDNYLKYSFIYNNASNTSIVRNTSWWTMTPASFTTGDVDSKMGTLMLTVNNAMDSNHHDIAYTAQKYDGYSFISPQAVVRPVTSLKSCVQWKSGDGSANNPYEILENGGC